MATTIIGGILSVAMQMTLAIRCTNIFQCLNPIFKEYHQSMKNYRDVFAAHWDDDGEGKRSYLDNAFECVVFLHEYIFTNFNNSSALQDKISDLRGYYETCYKEARKCYQAIS